jgi:hypothetical protein
MAYLLNIHLLTLLFRWSRGGPQQQGRKQSIQDRSGSNTPNTSNRQSTPYAGNAWERRSGSGTRTPQSIQSGPDKKKDTSAQSPATPTAGGFGTMPETHTPVKGFNTDEVKSLLGKGM